MQSSDDGLKWARFVRSQIAPKNFPEESDAKTHRSPKALRAKSIWAATLFRAKLYEYARVPA